MVTAACAAMILVIAGCAAYAAPAVRGHSGGRERLGCLRRTVAVHALIAATLAAIAATLAAICAVLIGRAARHPARHARYLAARAVRRIPGRPGDGQALDPDEARAFIAICRGWKDAGRTEGSRT